MPICESPPKPCLFFWKILCGVFFGSLFPSRIGSAIAPQCGSLVRCVCPPSWSFYLLATSAPAWLLRTDRPCNHQIGERFHIMYRGNAAAGPGALPKIRRPVARMARMARSAKPPGLLIRFQVAGALMRSLNKAESSQARRGEACVAPCRPTGSCR